jgi:phosphoribosyl-AMP cyclohydrolase
LILAITITRKRARGGVASSSEPNSTHRPAGAASVGGLFVSTETAMELDFDKGGGLIPAIVQEAGNGEILMLGFMNREALEKTQRTGLVTFFSRSRRKLWTKGETSGQKLLLRELRVDCDLDALLVRAELEGGAVCHEGYRSCFYRRLAPDGSLTVVEQRVLAPEALYGGSAPKGSKP